MMPARAAAAAAATALSAAGGDALWREAERAMEAALASGAYPPGAQLPSEGDLAASLSLHRHTLRRAIASLVARGLLEIRRGRGTFVAGAPLPYVIGPRSRFTLNVREAGQAPSSRIVRSARVAAEGEVARWLQLPEGAPVIVLEVVRYADRLPIVLARHSIPGDRFEGFAERFSETASMTRTFESFGADRYTRRATHMSARLPDPAEAGALQIARSAPLLIWTSLNVDPNNVPIDLDESAFAASRVSIVLSDG